MSEQLLITAGLLALLTIAMLIIAGLALTLRGFQTLNATIVSLLQLGLHEHAESPATNGDNSFTRSGTVQHSEDPPPDFGEPPIDPAPPIAPPPSRPPSPNGRRGV